MNRKVNIEYIYGRIKICHPHLSSATGKKWQSILGLLIIPLCFSIMAPSVHAEFFNSKTAAKWYKWVDENGQTHYGEIPPPKSIDDSQIERIKAGGSKPSDQDEALEKLEDRRKSLEDNAKQRSDSKEDASSDKAQAALLEAKKKNCETAKKNIAQFESGGQIKMKNSEGEYEYLDQETITKQQEKNQAYLRDNCG